MTCLVIDVDPLLNSHPTQAVVRRRRVRGFDHRYLSKSNVLSYTHALDTIFFSLIMHFKQNRLWGHCQRGAPSITVQGPHYHHQVSDRKTQLIEILVNQELK